MMRFRIYSTAWKCPDDEQAKKGRLPNWWEKTAVFVAGIWSDVSGGEPPSCLLRDVVFGDEEAET